MKNTMWRIPLVALCSSLLFSVCRSIINPLMLYMIMEMGISVEVYIVFASGMNLVGLLLIPLGGFLFCRRVPVRKAAISATIVAALTLAVNIISWTVNNTPLIGIPFVTDILSQLVRILSFPVSIFNLSFVSNLLHRFSLSSKYIQLFVRILEAGLPYLYVLFADRTPARDPGDAYQPYEGPYKP